jgi:GntR family transcriptional regulator, transcriptional repressor for pyruvate dehydrogenase complex
MAPQEATPLFAATVVQRPRQQVEGQIRKAISSGALKAGQKLPSEATLALNFGVSRTTVREALRSLVTDGLIEKTPGASGGSFVRSLNHETLGADLVHDIENLLSAGSIGFLETSQVRRMLEMPSARLAAQHRSTEELEALRQIIAEERTLSHDDPRVPELDTRFHSLISQASGNRVVAAFVIALHEVTEPAHQLHLDAEVGKGTFQQHLAIVQAIERRDPAAAEAAMGVHLEYLERHPRGAATS